MVTCSRECASKIKGQVDWSQVDLVELLKHNNKTEIGEILGCSNGAVSRKAQKLGLKSKIVNSVK